MVCPTCNDLRGREDNVFMKDGVEHYKSRNHIRQGMTWSELQTSATQCEICSMVVRGCQECLKQHNKDEAQIESCDISFLFGIPGAKQSGENGDGDGGDEMDEENEDGEEEESESEDEDDGDVDKDVIFRLKDGSWFIVQMFVDADGTVEMM